MKRLKVGETYDYVGVSSFPVAAYGSSLILGLHDDQVWYRYTPDGPSRQPKDFTTTVEDFLSKYRVPSSFFEVGKKYGFKDSVSHYRVVSVSQDEGDLGALVRYVSSQFDAGSFYALDEEDFKDMVEVS